MKMRILPLLISASLPFALSARSVVGNVYDDNTKEPVPGVSVYLDGTTVGTVTAPDGSFRLDILQRVNTRLVYSHISYESFYIEDPYGELPDEVYLIPKEIRIENVSVHSDPFTREQKLQVFREQFLGRTVGGRNSRIENEDDIVLYYNPMQKRLSAYCNMDMVVLNDYLGYKMYYDLSEFYVLYDRVSLSDAYMQWVYRSGSVRFEGLYEDDPHLRKRRDDTYKISPQAFFKAFATCNMAFTGFRLFNGKVPLREKDFPEYFKIAGSDGQWQLSLVAGTDISTKPSSEDKSYGNREICAVVRIRDRMLNYSEMIFFTDLVNIDGFGNINGKEGIMFVGDMAQKRVGDLLPLDFEPANDIPVR